MPAGADAPSSRIGRVSTVTVRPLAAEMPDLDVRTHPDIGDARDVRLAMHALGGGG